MTAVVAVQNIMAHEFNEEMPYMASTTNNEITENNGSESKLNSKKENIEKTSQPSLESMGLQPEAEDDTVLPNIETSHAPKGSSKRKSSDHQERYFCEHLLGEISQSQQLAIDRISTTEGLKQMKKWLENARSAQQTKHLCMLLAQCWKANINVQDLSLIGIGKLVREFKKHPDKDVKLASGEVLKKWKTLVANDEKRKLEGKLDSKSGSKSSTKTAIKSAAPVVSKLPVQASSSATVSSKPQSSSTPVMPKIEKKKESTVTRPNTARVRISKPRLTGLEGEDEEESRAPPVKKVPPTVLPSRLTTPITKSIVPKKLPGSAVMSNSFMDALSAGSSANAMEIQRKRKKPPPVIDLPLNSPLEPVVTTPISAPPVPAAAAPEIDLNGPDPSRVPPPDVTRDKRRIHFADDKGQELVLIKYIENVLLNKGHRPSSDMKHADAEAERISLKQMKSGMEDEEDEEEMKMDFESSAVVQNEDAWKPMAYCKSANKQYSQGLIDEEDERHGNVMRAFVALPEIPLDHPAEPDKVPNANSKMRTPDIIPVDFVIEEVAEEDEAMDVDVLISPDNNGIASDNLLTVSSSPVPAASTYTQPPQQVPAPDVTNFQILNNVDIHGSGRANHPPRPVPMPVPFPLNPLYSVPPPVIPQNKPPPQPVPAPAEELVILADHPSNLNAPKVADVSSLLQKFQAKGKTLNDILVKVKGTKAPPASTTAAAPSSTSAATINTDFSVPPPAYPVPNMQPQVTPSTFGIAPANDLEILSYDIHKAPTAQFNAPRHPAPAPPEMRGSRQQQQHPAPHSTGQICSFFLKGTCTFGPRCKNEHRQQQHPPFGYRGAGPPRFNLNNRGGGSGRGGSRFNSSGFNKGSFNSSNQNSEEAQDQDNYYRSRKRMDRGRSNRSRSPDSPRRRRRSRSGEDDSPRYRRRRSRSPLSRSVSRSPEHDRRRRRTPSSSRSASRSPIRSPSPTK